VAYNTNGATEMEALEQVLYRALYPVMDAVWPSAPEAELAAAQIAEDAPCAAH
jgi:hypothetical protein